MRGASARSDKKESFVHNRSAGSQFEFVELIGLLVPFRWDPIILFKTECEPVSLSPSFCNDIDHRGHCITIFRSTRRYRSSSLRWISLAVPSSPPPTKSCTGIPSTDPNGWLRLTAPHISLERDTRLKRQHFLKGGDRKFLKVHFADGECRGRLVLLNGVCEMISTAPNSTVDWSMKT